MDSKRTHNLFAFAGGHVLNSARLRFMDKKGHSRREPVAFVRLIRLSEGAVTPRDWLACGRAEAVGLRCEHLL
jgi:hypothetical protein